MSDDPASRAWSRRRLAGGLGAALALGGVGATRMGRHKGERSKDSDSINEPDRISPAPPLSAPRPLDPGCFAGVSLAHAHRRGAGYGSARCREELRRLAGLGVNAVSLMPFGYLPADASGEIRFGGDLDRSLTDDDLRRAAEDAAALDLKVCVKPHLWGRSFWGGQEGPHSLDASTAEGGWPAWFQRYGDFAAYYARLAEEVGAALFCVGLELTAASLQNPGAWAAVAARCRAVYRGSLTYGANWWEEAEGFADWDAFDYIGVDAYYPLSEAADPSAAELADGWRDPLSRLGALAARFQRPVLLMEAGLRAVRGAAARPWDQGLRGEADPALQARAVEGLLAATGSQPWIRGVFLWKWFSDGGETERDDYDLRGGPAEAALARWWGRGGGGQ